jgi:hypothetical protein
MPALLAKAAMKKEAGDRPLSHRKICHTYCRFAAGTAGQAIF